MNVAPAQEVESPTQRSQAAQSRGRGGRLAASPERSATGRSRASPPDPCETGPSRIRGTQLRRPAGSGASRSMARGTTCCAPRSMRLVPDSRRAPRPDGNPSARVSADPPARHRARAGLHRAELLDGDRPEQSCAHLHPIRLLRRDLAERGGELALLLLGHRCPQGAWRSVWLRRCAHRLRPVLPCRRAALAPLVQVQR